MGPRPVNRDGSHAVCLVACSKSADVPSLSHKHQCVRAKADRGSRPCAGFDWYSTLHSHHQGQPWRNVLHLHISSSGEPGNPSSLPYRIVLVDHFVIKIPNIQDSKKFQSSQNVKSTLGRFLTFTLLKTLMGQMPLSRELDLIVMYSPFSGCYLLRSLFQERIGVVMTSKRHVLTSVGTSFPQMAR